MPQVRAKTAATTSTCSGSVLELPVQSLPHALGWLQSTRSSEVWIRPQVQGEFDTPGLVINTQDLSQGTWVLVSLHPNMASNFERDPTSVETNGSFALCLRGK